MLKTERDALAREVRHLRRFLVDIHRHLFAVVRVSGSRVELPADLVESVKVSDRLMAHYDRERGVIVLAVDPPPGEQESADGPGS